MKAVEIITVRLDRQREGLLLRDLCRELDASDRHDAAVDIEVYRHATVQTDLSIHLRWETRPSRGLKTTLGQRLASALREFGPTNHSIWQEEERK